MIRLKPTAGLCNRMRAIDSAVGLARDLNRRLDIYWVCGSDLNCPFHLLFEPIDDPLVHMHERRIRPAMFLHTKYFLKPFVPQFYKTGISFSVYDNDALKEFDFKSIPASKKIYIESFGRFFQGPTKYQIFIPISALRARIDERTMDFDEHTIGVHVRRTDHVKSIAKSPDELFIAQMQHEVQAQPLTRFYLATDSMEVKQKFTDIFGDRIMTTSFEASRNTKEGVQEALVELYALSRTSKILGSYWSSYSHTAADLGKIKIFKVTADTVAQ